MSDRRENIKKTLGISEYPWSSEDEEEITSPATKSLNTSLSDSANIRRYERMRRQQQSSSQQSSSQPMPSTSSLNPTPPPTGPPQNPAAATLAPATKPHLVRADGRLYWSMRYNSRFQEMLSSPRAAGAADSSRRDPGRTVNVVQPDASVVRRSDASVVRRPDASVVRRPDASIVRRPDALLRRVSPLREIRGILAIKKAAAKRLSNHRFGVAFPNLSSAFYTAGCPRSTSQMLPTRNPIFTPCSATASLEANLRASRSRRAYNERLARANGLAIPSTSGLGSPARQRPSMEAPGPSMDEPGPSVDEPGPSMVEPGPSMDEPGPSMDEPSTSRGVHVFHTAPSPTRAGDHDDHGDHVIDEIMRSLARPAHHESYVQVSPVTTEASVRPDSPAGAGDTSRGPAPADMSLDEEADVEVLEVETAAEATEDAGADSRPDDEDAKSTCVEPATSCIEEPCGMQRKRESKDDTVKELNQCLLRLLECPVCLEWMEPPMSQCRRGHLVCVSCRSRLSACPVCRTAFSSVRNRAMEGVAEILRYPCRHACGREVRLRRRTAHEANCVRRRYTCPVPACANRAPLAQHDLAPHFQSKHVTMLRIGRKQRFTVKVNAEQHEHWLVLALQQVFHLRIDVDIRTWGVAVYAAFIGPKNTAKTYTYEVTVLGNHSSRKLVYARASHSDLESPSVNVSRQDCFYLSLDQALNFLRRKNRDCDSDNTLSIHVELTKNEVQVEREESGDS